MRLSLLVLLSCWAGFAYPSPSLALGNTEAVTGEALSLVPFSQVLKDATGQLTLHEILSGKYDQQFVSYDKDVLDFRFTSVAYWLSIELVNETHSHSHDWYLGLMGPLSQNVQVYLGSEQKNSYKKIPLLPQSRASKYHLPLMAGGKYQLLIRVQDKRAPLVIWPKLYSSSQMLGVVMMSYPLYSFIVGGLMALALYNLVSAISLRDTGLFALSAFIFGYVLELGNLSGLLHFFSFARDYLNNQGGAFAFLIISSGLSLAIGLLDIQKTQPRLYRWYRVGFWVSAVFIVISFFLPFSVAVSAVFGAAALLLIFATLILLSRQKVKISSTLQQAILLVVFGSIPAVLRGLGIIEYAPEYIDGLYVILMLALILLSRSQAERIQQFRIEAEQAIVTAKAKDEFMTTMSHELRTPMNTIFGLGNLLEQTPLSGKQLEYVSRLGIASTHMLSLVDDILDLARIERSQLRLQNKNFNLDSVLFQVQQLLGKQVEDKGLNFTIHNNFHLPDKQLNGDVTRLRQILLNLLDNAVKFTQTGQIELSISPEKVTSDMAVLRFEVSDSGVGIPPKYQDSLFQPFIQVGEIKKGSGLGLAICHKLVEQMGGVLGLSSQPGAGSRFFFALTFPLFVPDSGGGSAESIEVTHRCGERRILLVDDDELNLFYACELLDAMGANVCTAKDGREAIDCLQHGQFDLVLMDLRMPVMDGYEATRIIREERKEGTLKIIALTAHAVAGERERCLRVGMDDYMTKPFVQKDLQQMLNKWLPQDNK